MLPNNQINLKKIFSLPFLLFFLYVQSQDSEYIKGLSQKITVPSPSVYEFSKFGNVPLNGSTGGFNYSVPVYTIQSGDITVPISIGYYSNGVQIDALSGIVGTNWNLNAGGVISRVVRDYPDEQAGVDGRLYFPADDLFINIQDHVADIKNIERDLNYISFYDGEQDLFSFNFNGISGSFYFDKNLVPHISSEQTLKITFEMVNGVSKFTIIDEKGYKYLFGGSSGTIETTLSYNQCDNVENGSAITGWFLTEIISPNNNSITFSYDPNEYYYSNNLSISASAQDACGYQIVWKLNQPEIDPAPLLTPTQLNTCLNSSTTTSKVLTAINFQNNSVVFNYNVQRLDGGGKSLKEIKVLKNTELIKQVDFNYDVISARSTPLNSIISTVGETGVNFRMFLKDITFKGNLTSSNYEKYSFEYYNPDQLPARLTYSKDKFGYNNGTINSTPFSNKTLPAVSINNLDVPFPSATANTEVVPDFIHYGMLKKITYPTGGYSEVLYEPNKAVRTSETKVPLSNTLGVIKYCDSNTTPATGSFEFVSNGLPINFEAIGATQGPTCSMGSTNNKYNIKVYKNNQIILTLDTTYGVALSSDPAKSCLSSWSSLYANEPICTDAGSTYKITMTLEKGGVYGSIKIKYNGDFVQETVYGAGVRVKEITDYTNGMSYNKRKIYYNKLVDYLSTNSTMQHAFEPQYNKNSNLVIWCPNYNPMHLPYCTDYGPRLVYTYSISSNPINVGYLTRQSVNYSAITEIFENNGVKNGAVEKIFAPSPNSPARLLNGTDIYGDTPDNYAELLNDKIVEETTYDNLNQIKQKKVFEYALFDNNYLPAIKARKNYIFPLDELGFPAAYTDVCVDPLTYFPNLYNYSVWGYKNYYGIIKLGSTIETNYFPTQNLVTTSTNVYGSSPFYQLKSSSITNSQNQILKTEYKYSQDLIGIEQTPFMQQLVDANRVNEPITIKTFNGVTKLSERHLKYDKSSSTGNLLLPKEAYTNKGLTDINIAISTDRKLIFDQYDDTGNILQYTLENGAPVSVIWGYNKTQPIAKIENATNTQVATALGVSNVSALNEANMIAINALRNNASFSNCMITTYTHIPLIGVSTITDPKGDTITYTYDSFGRLEFVKDKDDNILSESQYNYKQ